MLIFWVNINVLHQWKQLWLFINNMNVLQNRLWTFTQIVDINDEDTIFKSPVNEIYPTYLFEKWSFSCTFTSENLNNSPSWLLYEPYDCMKLFVSIHIFVIFLAFQLWFINFFCIVHDGTLFEERKTFDGLNWISAA